MKNKLTYEEAVEQLKILEVAQRKRKSHRKTKISFMRSKLQEEMSIIKVDINLLLSVISAHKQARKLYGQVQELKRANDVLRGFYCD